MSDEVDRTLMAWLAAQDAESLSRIIANRPEAVQPPWPRHLLALAKVLGDPGNTTAAIRRLPAPGVQVLRAVAALHSRATSADLARLLGVDAGDTGLSAELVRLEEHALVWTSPQGRLIQPTAVRDGWRHPLGLGRSIEQMLADSPTFAHVKEIAGRLGLPRGGSRARLSSLIADFLRDPEKLDVLISAGPEGVRDVLLAFAHDGPIRQADGAKTYYYAHDSMTPVRWAVERGLLVARDWQYAEMPREAALALRGPGYHAPFTPSAPEVETAQADPTAVEQRAAGAAGHLLDRAGALIDAAAKTPIPTVKTGGVGQREIKRLAKDLSCTEDEIRLLLEAVHSAGLLAFSAAGLIPGHGSEAWMQSAPAARLTDLISGWWSSERSALRTIEGKRNPALGGQEHSEVAVVVRHAVLRVLADLPEGRAAVDPLERIAWLAPLYPADLIEECLRPALAEAALTGLVSDGAVSPLGRALADGQDVTARAADLTAATRRNALFGTDLTAVVTGSPTAELARLLDLAADRETRGNASVWRFSPASVRRAMDDGFTSERLGADLAAIAQGVLPQPLLYLLKDVARRHGEATVADVVCVIRGAEPLLAEIAAHRRLAKAGLRLLAPTVLASSLPATATLAALRGAGYFPVPEGADGVPVIQRAAPDKKTPTGKTPGPRTALSPPPHRAVMDPRELTARLAGQTGPEPSAPQKINAAIARYATGIGTTERIYLQFLINAGHRVQISTDLPDGTRVRKTLENGELDGSVLNAWCPDDSDYHRIELGSIVRVGR